MNAISRLWKPVSVLIAALVLTAGSCGPAADSETTTTTEGDSSTETTAAPATTTTAPATSATVAEAGPTTTTSGETTGDLDCLDFWSEEFVQNTAGDQFTFEDMNNDGTLCAFTAVPNSIGVFFRIGDQDLFDQAKAGAAGTGLQKELAGVCDDAWYLDTIPLIAEGYSADQGLIFNATLVGPDDPLAVASDLLSTACQGPLFAG